MRHLDCHDAMSAGVFLDGHAAILSFITNTDAESADVSVVLSRDLLRLLHQSISAVLDEKAAPGPGPDAIPWPKGQATDVSGAVVA